MAKTWLKLALLVTPLLFARMSEADDVFNDGRTHTISSYSYRVSVEDGWGAAGTTLNVVTGADIGWLSTYGNSVVNISGGDIDWINAYGNSVVDISGGDIYWIDGRGDSVVDISGGTFNWLNAYDSGTLYVSGGESNWLTVRDSGTIHMTGGNVDWLEPVGGVSHFYGPSLTYYGQRITGELLDGTHVSIRVREGGGQIRLHTVAEPSTILLLIFAAIPMTVFAWQRRKNRAG